MLAGVLRLAILAGLACVLGAGSPISPSAWAQTAVPAGPSGPAVDDHPPAIDYHPNHRTLTVHVNDLPLQQVIEELSKQTHIRFRPPAPAQLFDNRPVTASFERMPIERAIKQLLGPSNTAMLYGTARTAGPGAQPVLKEVRVLDMGIIPSLASSNESTPTPFTRLLPEQLQARREEMLKHRGGTNAGSQR